MDNGNGRRETMTYDATIHERGNGHASIGDYVSGDGCLYRIVEITGHICTGDAGCSNYQHGRVVPVDWDDITDDQAEDILCGVVVAEA